MLLWIVFTLLPRHISIFTIPLICVKRLLACKGPGCISKPDVCSCCVNPLPPNSSWTIWKSAGGQMVKSEIPPSLSCHKSCLAAQNKLLLETSLLALYPLPFITSEELQKAGKKNHHKHPCNPWTNTTDISKSAFLSLRQGNVCHLYNHSFLWPLWPFGEFNRANCSSFTRRDGYNLMRHLRRIIWHGNLLKTKSLLNCLV